MTDVQHTIKVRIDKNIITINCPPFASIATLDAWLAQMKRQNPDWVIVSKSWSSNAAT